MRRYAFTIVELVITFVILIVIVGFVVPSAMKKSTGSVFKTKISKKIVCGVNGDSVYSRGIITPTGIEDKTPDCAFKFDDKDRDEVITITAIGAGATGSFAKGTDSDGNIIPPQSGGAGGVATLIIPGANFLINSSTEATNQAPEFRVYVGRAGEQKNESDPLVNGGDTIVTMLYNDGYKNVETEILRAPGGKTRVELFEGTGTPATEVANTTDVTTQHNPGRGGLVKYNSGSAASTQPNNGEVYVIWE